MPGRDDRAPARRMRHLGKLGIKELEISGDRYGVEGDLGIGGLVDVIKVSLLPSMFGSWFSLSPPGFQLQYTKNGTQQ